MNTASGTNLRVVLDTNVYVSAFTHPQGVPFRLWQQLVARRGTLLVSPSIMRELATVLRRLEWQGAETITQLKLVAHTAEMITPPFTLAVFTGAEEPDNRILECAVAGRADLIVSGDRDLQRLKVPQHPHPSSHGRLAHPGRPITDLPTHRRG